MADSEDTQKLLNGEVTEIDYSTIGKTINIEEEEETLYLLLNRLLAGVMSSDPKTTLLQKINASLQDVGPKLPEASRNSLRQLLIWTRQGTPLRQLLVISVGSIILLAVTGLLLFLAFFTVATTSAVIISLLVALAAAGGFLAIFFAGLATVYVGALLTAAFVISTVTISTITFSLIATGWIGFFWMVWLLTKKTVGLAKHSLSITGSTFLAYSASGQVHRLEGDKDSE